MVNDNRSIDVYVGEEFLKLAGVPGGFFYSSEQKKSDFSKVSEILDAPQFVYIIMNGNSPFPPALFSAFHQDHRLAYAPAFELTVNDFERVCQPEEIIAKYHLADLKYEDKGNGLLKAGDLLVSIEIKRIDGAGVVMALFEGIRKALRGLSLENMPYTYSSNYFEERYEFKFFSSEKINNFNGIAERMNQELCQNDWKVTFLPGPDRDAGNLYSWKLSAKRLFSNACGF